MTETIEVATIIERLRDAQENSTQSIMGSDIFEEAADCLEALSEAVDGLGEQIVEAKKNAIYWRDNSTGLHEQLNVGESKLDTAEKQLDKWSVVVKEMRVEEEMIPICDDCNLPIVDNHWCGCPDIDRPWDGDRMASVAADAIKELQSRLDRALKIGEEREQSVDRLLAERDELRFRLGSIEKFDEASGLCCVKGCTELSVWCCPPLCEHHTALLEPVVETPHE